MTPTLLVVAKAPVTGRVKTRLGRDLGDPVLAARIAAASLLDTLAACAAAVGVRHCVLALDGDLGDAVHGRRIGAALAGWRVLAQEGDQLGERLARALARVSGPVVQIGMDTPQVSPELLRGLGAGLDGHDAVLAPASDGGWWALALADGPLGAPLSTVPMSRPTTYADTRAALAAAGLDVGVGPTLTDVDHRRDLVPVAAAAAGGRFAHLVGALR